MMKRTILAVIIIFLITGVNIAGAQDDQIKTAAGELIEPSKYCTLISTGGDGYPNARTMDAFKPDKNWVVWMGTNSNSRKVEEIRKDKKATLFYESPGGDGYVILKGEAFIVNDAESKARYFKEDWKKFYPGNRDHFILIKFISRKLEVVSYKRGLLGKEKTWEAPSVMLNKK